MLRKRPVLTGTKGKSPGVASRVKIPAGTPGLLSSPPGGVGNPPSALGSFSWAEVQIYTYKYIDRETETPIFCSSIPGVGAALLPPAQPPRVPDPRVGPTEQPIPWPRPRQARSHPTDGHKEA